MTRCSSGSCSTRTGDAWPCPCGTPQNIVTGTALWLGVTCGCDHDGISSPPSLCFVSPMTMSLLARCFSLRSSRTGPGFPPPAPFPKSSRRGAGSDSAAVLLELGLRPLLAPAFPLTNPY